MSSPFYPFWLEQALAGEGYPDPQPLSETLHADVCIVGGGYTGLWSAIALRQARPNWRIVVLEKDLCGAGASGRNGGCMLTWSAKYLTLRRLFGEQQARWLVSASEQAVHAIANFCDEHGIHADLRLEGTLYTATNQAQQGEWRQYSAHCQIQASTIGSTLMANNSHQPAAQLSIKKPTSALTLVRCNRRCWHVASCTQPVPWALKSTNVPR